ncbi:MAG: hypothetical protein AAGC92_14450 [Pseudomonadota bacterium]
MTKLTDTQSILLSQAAARPDGSLLPVPDSITATGAALTRSFTVLVKRGLAEKVMAQSDTSCRREEEDRRIGLKITPAGLSAIGVEAARLIICPWPLTAVTQIRAANRKLPHRVLQSLATDPTPLPVPHLASKASADLYRRPKNALPARHSQSSSIRQAGNRTS